MEVEIVLDKLGLDCKDWKKLWLLLCGDVESNPGPPRRSVAAKAPSAEEKIESLSSSFGQYEAKVNGLESELDNQRKLYDDKIKGIEQKLEVIIKDLGELKAGSGSGFDSLRESLIERLDATDEKVQQFTHQFEAFKGEYEAKNDFTSQKLAFVEESVKDFKAVSDGTIEGILRESQELRENYGAIEQRLKDIKVESSGKLNSLTTNSKDQRREYKAKFLDMDVEFQRMKDRMEMLSTILDDMHEKMYEFEQNKKNNLIFYGIRNRPHENPDSLKQHVNNLLRDNLNIRREIPVSKANRIYTGPEVRGVRPVLVSFESFKDRETVLRQAKALKKANIDVSEDFSKRTRENRQELRKFMRKVKRTNPERNCFLEYDRLYIDHKIFVFSEALGQVIEQTESMRYADPNIYSRPGTQMMMAGFGNNHLEHGFLGASRPPSGMSSRFERPLKSASAIPRLPPLNRTISLSTGAMNQSDPRDERIDEMERMVASYQEKLDNVTTNYQEKVNILENKLVDKEMIKSRNPSPPGHNGHGHNGVHYSQADYSDLETDAEDEPASPVHPIAQESKLISSIPEEDPVASVTPDAMNAMNETPGGILKNQSEAEMMGNHVEAN